MTALAQRLPTLFDLTDDLVQVLAVIGEAEERGEEPTDALAELETIETALAEKLEGYVSLVRHLEHLADARKAEADRLSHGAKTLNRTADYLRERLKVHMLTTGQQRIETGRHSIALRTNPPRVEVLEEMMVPSSFKRTVVTTTVDKRAIMQHIKDGGEIPDGVDIVREQRVEFR